MSALKTIFFKVILILFVVTGIGAGVGAVGVWVKYKEILSDEKRKVYVQLKTVNGDILAGSIHRAQNKEIHFESEGVIMFFDEAQIASSETLSLEEKDRLVALSAKQQTKQWVFQIFSFFSGKGPESDKYFTP